MVYSIALQRNALLKIVDVVPRGTHRMRIGSALVADAAGLAAHEVGTGSSGVLAVRGVPLGDVRSQT
jgi:hypothetical protein